METFAPFDAVDYLDSEEMIAEYLTAALEEENPAVFLVALADVARARGMNAIAQRAGISREHLSNALAPGAKPDYDTILTVLHSLGMKFTVTAAHVRMTE